MPKSKKDDFKKLKDKWYKKLKDSGFEDVEQDEERLKSWSSVFFIRHTVDEWQAKATYYQMATNFLEEYKFENEIERVIWSYHAHGMGVREIADTLRKAKIKSIGAKKSNIWLVIKKLKKSMYSMYLAKTPEYHE